jgi:hypothetical protein
MIQGFQHSLGNGAAKLRVGTGTKLIYQYQGFAVGILYKIFILLRCAL